MGQQKKVIAVLLIIIGICCGISLLEYMVIRYQAGQITKVEETKENENIRDGVEEHGQLSVEGLNLVDQYGEKLQLKGISSHGILWYPDFTGYLSVAETKKYGANVFRIAAYSDDQDGGYLQRPEETLRYVRSAIENVLANDMYAIVDWHVLKDENPLKNKEKAKEFFTQIAKQYQNEPGILYEICNEPNGTTTWDDIVDYANEIIPVIRQYAPNAVILVGTPNYSYSITKVQMSKLPYENLMYSYHFYAGQYGDEYSNMIQDCQNAGIPLFVTEWGINISGDKEQALKQGKEFVDYLNKEGISWSAWSLSNKEEEFSLLAPQCETYHEWQEKDFTDTGRIIFEALGE